MRGEVGEEKAQKTLALNADPASESPKEKGSKWSAFAAFFSRDSPHFKVLLVFLSVIAPLAVLYGVNAESFNHTYNGRSYYLFFVWLILLEFAFAWDKYNSKIGDSRKANAVFGLTLILPTLYVVVANFLGLNGLLMEIARPFVYGEMWLLDIPLAVELLVFSALFGLVCWAAYNKQGLKGFSPAIALLAAIGIVNMLTIFFPYSSFTPFQILCPPTASGSAGVLTLMGYNTAVMVNQTTSVPTVVLSNGTQFYVVNINWPCAGIDSLVIYSVVILAFLKKANIPWLQSAIYFGIGAAVTFFINILRIVTICLIGLNGGDIAPFHNFYGQLYSVIWIVGYLFLIIGTRILWDKHKVGKMAKLAESSP